MISNIKGMLTNDVENNEFDLLKQEIIRICMDKPYSEKECREHAEKYNMITCFEKYIKLYRDIC